MKMIIFKLKEQSFLHFGEMNENKILLKEIISFFHSNFAYSTYSWARGAREATNGIQSEDTFIVKS